MESTRYAQNWDARQQPNQIAIPADAATDAKVLGYLYLPHAYRKSLIRLSKDCQSSFFVPTA